MSCYVRSATVTLEGLVIYYDSHIPGGTIEKHCTIKADTIGEWYNLLFKPEQLKLYKFLDTMIISNLEVRRLQCIVMVDEILAYEQDIRFKIDLMNAIAIMDRTFTPPVINTRCGWQKELVDTIISNHAVYVIQTCRNEYNLKKYFKYVKTLR